MKFMNIHEPTRSYGGSITCTRKMIVENESLFMRFTKKEFCKVYKAFFAFFRERKSSQSTCGS